MKSLLVIIALVSFPLFANDLSTDRTLVATKVTEVTAQGTTGTGAKAQETFRVKYLINKGYQKLTKISFQNVSASDLVPSQDYLVTVTLENVGPTVVDTVAEEESKTVTLKPLATERRFFALEMK
jgi:hypothetical protein